MIFNFNLSKLLTIIEIYTSKQCSVSSEIIMNNKFYNELQECVKQYRKITNFHSFIIWSTLTIISVALIFLLSFTAFYKSLIAHETLLWSVQEKLELTKEVGINILFYSCIIAPFVLLLHLINYIVELFRIDVCSERYEEYCKKIESNLPHLSSVELDYLNNQLSNTTTLNADVGNHLLFLIGQEIEKRPGKNK